MEPNEDNEIVYASEDQVPAIADRDMVAIAERAERNMGALTRIKRAALSATNHRDWSSLGGEPYLEASGAEKIRGQFGISWALASPEFKYHDDGHYDVWVMGTFTLWGQSIQIVGTRSSKDPFYSARKQWVDGKKQSIMLPPSEVDRNNVMKGAVTNCIGSGVKRILGLRNLTWEDLAAAGVAVDKITRVEYKQSEGVNNTQASEITAMLDELCEKDPARIEAALVKLTTFEVTEEDGSKRTVAGKRTVADLTERQIPNVHKALKKQIAKRQTEQAKAAEGGTDG